MSAMRIATYTITSGTLDEVVSLAAAPGGISELYQGLPGFRHFDVVDLGGEMFASVTTWGSRDEADAAVTAAAGWVRGNLADRVRLESNSVGGVVLEA